MTEKDSFVEYRTPLYFSVLNDLLQSTARRWRTGIITSDIDKDATILNAFCAITKQSGYGINIEIRGSAQIAKALMELPEEARDYTHMFNGRVSFSVPSNKEAENIGGKGFTVNVGVDSLVLSFGRGKRVSFRRGDILSVKAVEKK